MMQLESGQLENKIYQRQKIWSKIFEEQKLLRIQTSFVWGLSKDLKRNSLTFDNQQKLVHFL